MVSAHILSCETIELNFSKNPVLIPLTEFREQEIMNKYAVQTDIEVNIVAKNLKLDSIVLGSRELSTIQRNVDELPGKRKRLRPGNVSPYREVPKDIPRPPHVKSKTPAGLVTGPESGRLQDDNVLEFSVVASTLWSGGLSSLHLFHAYAGCLILIQVTKECLDKAISICSPGVEYKKIGKIIHDHVDKFGYGIVRQFVGHGVGKVFHADPVIHHY
ncbi:hypothetical protein S245_016120, partial [Arachis hypogaea]